MRVDDVAGVDIARHVVGYHLTQFTRVQNASDDVAGNTCLNLLQGAALLSRPGPFLVRDQHPIPPLCRGLLRAVCVCDAGDGGERAGGKAVQVAPIKPTLQAPGTKRLKLKHDKLLLSFAFNFNSRRYMVVCVIQTRSVAGGVSRTSTGPTLNPRTESAHLYWHSP